MLPFAAAVFYRLEFENWKEPLNEELENDGLLVKSSLPPIVVNKVSLEPRQAHSCQFVCDCFLTIAAELSTCDSDHMAQNT